MKTKKTICLLLLAGLVLPFESWAATSTRTLTGVLNGKKKNITINVDSDTYNYIYNLPRLSCNQIPGCTGVTDRDRTYLTDTTQIAALAPLVTAIQAAAKKPDDQVRIAVSLAQNIAYDSNKYNQTLAHQPTHARFPYEVIYDNLQLCSENSFLVALLLTELGYASGVFVFPSAAHETAAIKCPVQYSYKNTGYCFIETTYRNIITYNTMANRYSGDYSFEELTPTGREFSPKQDYKDAQNLKKYDDKLAAGKLGKKSRKKYNKLIKKYGL